MEVQRPAHEGVISKFTVHTSIECFGILETRVYSDYLRFKHGSVLSLPVMDAVEAEL